MRYLTENNDYEILYFPIRFMSYSSARIGAYLKDKKTNQEINDSEINEGNLEKCLMKLGKRLIKRWQNRKK